MLITSYHRDLSEAVRHAYNNLVLDLPHCQPVSSQAWHKILNALTEPRQGQAFVQQQGLVAMEDEQVVGFVHFGMRPDGPPRDDGQLDVYREGALGAIGFYWYAPGHLNAGLALLARAEAFLREQGAHTVRAFHYDETLAFYHLEHAYLSSHLVHIAAALGLAGFRPTQGELTMAWRDFQAQPQRPNLVFELDHQWDRTSPRPGLILRAKGNGQELGICVCQPAHPNASDPAAQPWLYTPWLGVAPDARRKGMGRYLLLKALEAMSGQGYHHAAICCISDNYAALALYSNLGYRATDNSQVWIKHLD